MSGFFGLVREDGKTVQREFLESVAKDLSFRGPDGTRAWTGRGAGGCYASMLTGPVRQSARQFVTLGIATGCWGMCVWMGAANCGDNSPSKKKSSQMI